MTATAYGIQVFGVALTLGALVYAGQPRSWLWFADVAWLAGWLVVPWLGCGLGTRAMRDSVPATKALLVASVLLLCSLVGALAVSFIGTPDAQRGLVFLVLPVWQLLCMLPPCLVATGLFLRSARGRA